MLEWINFAIGVLGILAAIFAEDLRARVRRLFTRRPAETRRLPQLAETDHMTPAQVARHFSTSIFTDLGMLCWGILMPLLAWNADSPWHHGWGTWTIVVLCPIVGLAAIFDFRRLRKLYLSLKADHAKPKRRSRK